jgi:Arc/MetJ-type ribon-helix-helix transcriptional regulator
MDLKSLPGEVKERVRANLEAGHFQSVDEVVCEALRPPYEPEELFASSRDEPAGPRFYPTKLEDT